MTLISTSMFIAIASAFSALLPLLSMLTRYAYIKTPLKLLGILSGASLLLDYIAYVSHAKNNIAGNSYRLLEFFILSLIFYHAFRKTKFWMNTMIVVAVLFVSFYAINIVYFQQDKVNTYTNAFLALIMIVYCLIYFYYLMRDLPAEKISQLPMFWIAISLLIYWAGTFFLFIVWDYVTATLDKLSNNDKSFILWDLHNLLNIIKNLLFTVPFWLKVRSAGAGSHD